MEDVIGAGDKRDRDQTSLRRGNSRKKYKEQKEKTMELRRAYGNGKGRLYKKALMRPTIFLLSRTRDLTVSTVSGKKTGGAEKIYEKKDFQGGGGRTRRTLEGEGTWGGWFVLRGGNEVWEEAARRETSASGYQRLKKSKRRYWRKEEGKGPASRPNDRRYLGEVYGDVGGEERIMVLHRVP